MPVQDNSSIDWDYFWYSDKVPLADEVAQDLRRGIIQPRGTMFFYRMDGTILYSKENAPLDSLNQQVETRYDIVDYIGRRNLEVDFGANNGRDQRAASSQSVITFDKIDRGAYEVRVLYFLFADLQSIRDLTVKV